MESLCDSKDDILFLAGVFLCSVIGHVVSFDIRTIFVVELLMCVVYMNLMVM